MEWHEHTDESLIEYAASHLQHQGPASMEMQRRLLGAIRDFNTSSSSQSTTMINLTWAISALTVFLAIIAGLQLWAMLSPINPAPTGSGVSTESDGPAAARASVEWRGFYYPDLQAQQGKSISGEQLAAAPSFKTLQACVEWGAQVNSVAKAGFECAVDCRFLDVGSDVICQDSTSIVR